MSSFWPDDGRDHREFQREIVVRRRRRAVVLLVVGALLVGGIAYGIRSIDPIGSSQGCTVTGESGTVSLDLDQAHNASLIAATAVARGLPARAATIALAAAYQEADLHNLDHGDRDSLGLFQQRPSQGWGTPEQIMNPAYAVGSFYDALVKVPDYTSIAVTVAAQSVQRSAFPEAYADHEADARLLASALTGYSPAAFTCTIDRPSGAAEAITDSGLTPRADAALSALKNAFGALSVGGFEPGGVTTGHMTGSAHYEGRAVDVFFRPVSADNQRAGWALAQWAVANADRLDLATVIFDRRIWTAARSDEGWRTYVPPDGPTDNPILLHEDHVHVDVV